MAVPPVIMKQDILRILYALAKEECLVVPLSSYDEKPSYLISPPVQRSARNFITSSLRRGAIRRPTKMRTQNVETFLGSLSDQDRQERTQRICDLLYTELNLGKGSFPSGKDLLKNNLSLLTKSLTLRAAVLDGVRVLLPEVICIKVTAL